MFNCVRFVVSGYIRGVPNMTTTVEQISKSVYHELARDSLGFIDRTIDMYEKRLEAFEGPINDLMYRIHSLTCEIEEADDKYLIYEELDKSNKALKSVAQARANIQAALDGCNLIRKDRILQQNLINIGL